MRLSRLAGDRSLRRSVGQSGKAPDGDERRDVTPGSRVSGEGARLSGIPPRIDPHAQAVVAAVLRDRWDRWSPVTAGKLQAARQAEADTLAGEVLERLGRCGWRLVREVER